MKVATLLASALVSAGVSSAAPVDDRFPDHGPFKMMALAYESPIHYAYVDVSGGFFYIYKDTNSTCGSDEPVLDGPNDSGVLTTYGDGKQNTQEAFINISGAGGGIFSLAPSQDPATVADDVTDRFTRVAGPDISQLYYDGGNWLACPTETDGQYAVYAEKAYGHEGKDKCIPFEIRTDKVNDPKNCEYY
ncbi:putative cell wall protein [Diplodia seriata]|uniref:Putative cell wall protein n=1 Tax=Diplodia seriata TaxID=420778 RepID=A0A0G2GUN6_9PEZI|nr:putative cell wall protein [Diplodia seriata]